MDTEINESEPYINNIEISCHTKAIAATGIGHYTEGENGNASQATGVADSNLTHEYYTENNEDLNPELVEYPKDGDDDNIVSIEERATKDAYRTINDEPSTRNEHSTNKLKPRDGRIIATNITRTTLRHTRNP